MPEVRRSAQGTTRRRWLGAAGVASLAPHVAPAARAQAQAPVARIDLPDNTQTLPVWSEPGGGGVVTRLPQDVQVTVTGQRAGTDGMTWAAVRLWNAVDGYVPAGAIAYSPAPPKPASVGPAPAPWKPDVPAPQ
ncbi:MAG TPA: hypothetical protein VFX49_17735, partial [Chloroflexota bacterium]|nr:hypothetical protein [Chloroflexota bacterium]